VRGILAVVLLLSLGCRTAPPSEEPGGRWWSEYLEPRMLTFYCDEDPERPARVLGKWLDLLGPTGVRSRKAGLARLRVGESDWLDGDYLLRWRPHEGRLDVQIACLGGLMGGFSRKALSSLRFAMESNGVWTSEGEASGASPPERRRPGAPNMGQAVDLEMEAMGLVLLKENIEQGANVQYFGRAGGVREWQVIADNLDGNDPILEISHDSVPFDAEGERNLLARILDRMAGK
jgi:hypothetical protein